MANDIFSILPPYVSLAEAFVSDVPLTQQTAARISYTVPTGYWVVPLILSANFATGAVAGGNQIRYLPSYPLPPAVSNGLIVPAGFAQAAAASTYYTFALDVATSSSAPFGYASVQIPLAPMPPGSTIGLASVFVNAGDSWTTPGYARLAFLPFVQQLDHETADLTAPLPFT